MLKKTATFLAFKLSEVVNVMLRNVKMPSIFGIFTFVSGQVRLITICLAKETPLVADLFLFCCERDFMMSLPDDKQADMIDAFNTTSRYLDDILNIMFILTIW